MDDRWYSPRPSGLGNRLVVLSPLSGLVSERFAGQLLFWWNVALDRGGRGHGYGAAVGSTAGHAELRRVCAERPVARPAVMEKSRVAPDTRHPDKLDRAVIFLGPPGAGN